MTDPKTGFTISRRSRRKGDHAAIAFQPKGNAATEYTIRIERQRNGGWREYHKTPSRWQASYANSASSAGKRYRTRPQALIVPASCGNELPNAGSAPCG